MNGCTNMDAHGHTLHKILFKILRHIISCHSNDDEEKPHFTQLKTLSINVHRSISFSVKLCNVLKTKLANANYLKRICGSHCSRSKY